MIASPLSDAVPCCSKCPLARLCLAGEMKQTNLEKVDGVVQRRVHLRKGEPLYLIGDPVTSLYAIRVGTVKSHVTTEDGRTQVVGFHFPGELIGLDSSCWCSASCARTRPKRCSGSA